MWRKPENAHATKTHLEKPLVLESFLHFFLDSKIFKHDQNDRLLPVFSVFRLLSASCSLSPWRSWLTVCHGNKKSNMVSLGWDPLERFHHSLSREQRCQKVRKSRLKSWRNARYLWDVIMGMTWFWDSWFLISEFLVWPRLALLLWGCHQKRSPPPKQKNLCIWYTLEIYLNHFECVKNHIGGGGNHILFPSGGFHTFQRAFFEAEAVQVKRMTESNMRQQYMEHGLSKLTVPSYGDVGEEAFGKVGRFLVTWSLWDWLGVWDSHQVVVSFWFGEWFNLEQAQCWSWWQSNEVHWIAFFFMNSDFWRLDFS